MTSGEGCEDTASLDKRQLEVVGTRLALGRKAQETILNLVKSWIGRLVPARHEIYFDRLQTEVVPEYQRHAASRQRSSKSIHPDTLTLQIVPIRRLCAPRKDWGPNKADSGLRQIQSHLSHRFLLAKFLLPCNGEFNAEGNGQ